MGLPELCLMGTILICIVWAVRAAAQNRLPRRTFTILWTIVMLRLLVPVSIPSPVSVYALFQEQSPAQNMAVHAEAVFSNDTEDTERGASAVTPAPHKAPMYSVRLETQPTDVLMAVWLAGAAAAGGASLVLYLALLRRFRGAAPVDTQAVRAFVREHPLRRRLEVRSSGKIRAPLTYGIVRPVILLPESVDLTDTERLDYILMHEYVHVRRFDTLRKILLTAACCLYWWNPLVWVMYVLANRDTELACDECVVARCGGPARYARVLIRLEEEKLTSFVPAMGSGAHAVTERIKAIMKLKKKGVLSIAVAGALVVGVGTAFATSAPEPHSADTAGAIASVADDTVVAEDAAWEATPNVEWWTAEEYEAWLAEEKVALQGMIGERGWTQSEGWFTWTRERINEAIELYEQVLSDLRRGVRISKTVDGSEDTILAQGTAEELGQVLEAETPQDMEEYAPFGLTEAADGHLTYNGESVKFFADSVEIEPGVNATKYLYVSDDSSATACLAAEYRATPNGDGSVDPFGELVGIRRITDEEADELMTRLAAVSAEAEVTQTSEDIVSDADLAPYARFGLEYEITPSGIQMMYRGKPVHSLYDPVTYTWFANNMRGSDLGDDRVDLEAVYENGRLTGLQEVPESHVSSVQATYVADSSSSGEVGTTFEELFSRYAQFGLQFERTRTSSGGTAYNLQLNGRPVNKFVDDAPFGSVFSYESADPTDGGLSVHVVYKGTAPTGLEAD